MSNNKRGVWLLVLILVSPAVVALTHDGWVLAGSDISFDGVTFEISINQRWDTMTVGFQSEVFPIGLGECEASQFYRVCYIDNRWDFLKGYGTYNASNEERTPELHVTIEALTPAIKVTRTIDKNSYLVNDIGTVYITVNNEGEKRVFDLEYVDVVPPGFLVIGSKDVVVTGNTIKWNWPSLAGERSFWYKIKNIKPTNTSWNARLSYIFEENEYIKEIDPFPVTSAIAINPLTVSTQFSKTETKIGGSTTYSVTLTNTNTKRDIEVNEFSIVFPKNVYVNGYGDLTKNGNKLTWSGQVGYQESRVFKAVMKNDNSASNIVNVTVNNSFYNEIEMKTYIMKREYTDSFVSGYKKLAPSVKFMFDRTVIDVGADSNVRAFIDNPDDKVPLFDVEYTVESDLFTDFSGNLEYVLPGEKIEAFYFPFKAPSLENDVTYEVIFKGKYRTVFYEYSDFETSSSIKIKADPHYGQTEQVEENITPETNQTGNASSEIVNQETSPNATDQPVQESQSFIKKFLNALARLIADLF